MVAAGVGHVIRRDGDPSFSFRQEQRGRRFCSRRPPASQMPLTLGRRALAMAGCSSIYNINLAS